MDDSAIAPRAASCSTANIVVLSVVRQLVRTRNLV
jgi:hypothetical protein